MSLTPEEQEREREKALIQSETLHSEAKQNLRVAQKTFFIGCLGVPVILYLLAALMMG